MSEDELEWCQYCKTMWYEVRSEGAPCGINGCNIYTCCDKAFQEHVKKIHPEEYNNLFNEHKMVDLQNAFHVILYNNEILGVFDDIEQADKAIEEILNNYIRKRAKIISFKKNKIEL